MKLLAFVGVLLVVLVVYGFWRQWSRRAVRHSARGHGPIGGPVYRMLGRKSLAEDGSEDWSERRLKS
jgi:hypothetical protein